MWARAYIVVAIGFAVASSYGQEVTVVSPAGLVDTEGNSVEFAGGGSSRVQRLYPSSDFESLPDSHRLLTEIRFRPDASQSGPMTFAWPDYVLRLATTTKDTLDLDFASNITNEAIIAYDDPISLTTSNSGDRRGPKEFDVIVDLQHPFVYDPTMGNLLVDLTVRDGDPPGGFVALDAHARGSVRLRRTVGGQPDAVAADFGAGRGILVTQFVFEPGTIVLRPGDADQDLDFDQLDLVHALAAAKYLTGQAATWGEGDWNGAPGGSQGNPPPGDGRFDQLDVIDALASGTYLTGPYAAIQPNGRRADGQTSLVYDSKTGELAVDAPADTELTSINIDSTADIFSGEAAQNLGGSFDNDSDTNVFKATFGSSFGSLSFGAVAQTGLTEKFVLNDLTAIGSLAGGGDLGNVDLVYVPEPSSIVLVGVATVALLTLRHGRSDRSRD